MKRVAASRTRALLTPGVTLNSSRNSANTRVSGARAAFRSSSSDSTGVTTPGLRGTVRNSTDARDWTTPLSSS